MRFWIAFVLNVILSCLLGLALDWWVVAIVAFIVGLWITLKPSKAFLSAFLAVYCLYLAMALITDMQNDHILATRMADLILKVKTPYLIILITGIPGALVAGFAALSASLLRKRKPVTPATAA
ncbi:hypothetical protein MKQ68_08930 [Chitinophaga horti]|uniref:Uncharacterized protein n=1 Tax=Chitinophaga horti TaxID=2920382 RepID=A0ABY6J6F7_9BACT|nr:hypothetical protein [Chitinophaga horti]UYQ95218.1 hypothetical protein MKQ68_08930 [Chitinophaga horti]